MVISALSVLAVMLPVNSVFAQSGEQNPAAVADSFYAAITEGDEGEIRALLDPKVLIYESGNMESSLDEYANHHMPSDMKFMASMTREVISRQVIEEGSMAVVTTRSNITGNYDGKQLDLNSTETLVMVRGEEGWKIHHIHWSSKAQK